MKSHQIFALLIVTGVFFNSELKGQVYPDHYGTGNDVGVTVTSSPELQEDTASYTLTGTGYFPDLNEASRFLAQAGFGGTYEEIQNVSQIGIKAWLEEQFSIAPYSYETDYRLTYDTIVDLIHTVHPGEDIARTREYTDYVWWQRVFQDADVLRNKAAFALHQILVLGTRSIKLNPKGFGHTSYYDFLFEGAFGNFRDLLDNVTHHTLMGFYLSHFQNKKADPNLGTLPDENYAREIMQLFSIGLWELNNDGTQKLDGNGDPISTYDIIDIQELAKVFTGLSGGAWDTLAYPQFTGRPLTFDQELGRYDLTVPMIMWENHHDQDQKIMIDGSIIPGGQPGMDDIQDALDVLFNHANVGPFLAIRLIQQLVKSNPSPAYVNRVASAFNNNGNGVRGDMKAVFRAILLDPEARDCDAISNDPTTGKLKQPLERFIALCRGFDISSPSGRLWLSNHRNFANQFEQTFMGAPTVFNFFTPFYAEEDYVGPAGMVSPEFQILHSVTAIHYLNAIENVLIDRPFRNFTEVNPNSPRLKDNNADRPVLDFSDEITEYNTNGVNGLLDRLDIILCHGTLKPISRSIITNALNEIVSNGGFTSEEIVKNAIYFIMLTSDYTILK